MIYLWVNNRKIQQERDKNRDWAHQELLVKLKHILNTSEYDIFKRAAEDKGHGLYKVDGDFKKYLDSNAEWLPVYLKDFLDDGRKHIMEYKLSSWL
jgi:hypothetical protein